MPDRKKLDVQAVVSTKGSEVLAGHERGGFVRDALKLDQADASPFQYAIVFPQNITAITLSFFVAMFSASVTRLGPKAFAEKYKIEGRASVLRTVEEGLSRIERQEMLQSA